MLIFQKAFSICTHTVIFDGIIQLQPKGQFVKQQALLYVVSLVVSSWSSGRPTCIISPFTQ